LRIWLWNCPEGVVYIGLHFISVKIKGQKTEFLFFSCHFLNNIFVISLRSVCCWKRTEKQEINYWHACFIAYGYIEYNTHARQSKSQKFKNIEREIVQRIDISRERYQRRERNKAGSMTAFREQSTCCFLFVMEVKTDRCETTQCHR
jgi:hypothetical protein